MAEIESRLKQIGPEFGISRRRRFCITWRRDQFFRYIDDDDVPSLLPRGPAKKAAGKSAAPVPHRRSQLGRSNRRHSDRPKSQSGSRRLRLPDPLRCCLLRQGLWHRKRFSFLTLRRRGAAFGFGSFYSCCAWARSHLGSTTLGRSENSELLMNPVLKLFGVKDLDGTRIVLRKLAATFPEYCVLAWILA